MATRGAISIEVVADTARFAADLKAQLRTVMRAIRTDPILVDADTSPFARRIRQAQADADSSFRGLFDTLKRRAEKAGAGIGTALITGMKLAVASGGAPLIAAVASLLSSIGPAALAVIPAAVGALATFKVALLGVGEALKNVGDAEKFNEALEKLSPNARKFALAVRSIMPGLSALKNAVQDRFFLGLDKDVIAASKSLLGPLKSGMTQTAGRLNGIVRELTKFAASAKGVALVNSVFDVTNKVVAQLSGAFGPLLNRVSDWIVKASNSGVNSAFMEARDTLSSLAETARNVSSAVGSVFGGLGKDAPGVAQSLAEASKALKDFLASAQAQELLNTLGAAMDRVRAIALQVLAVLPSLVPALTGLAAGGFTVLLDAVQLVVDALAPLAEKLGGQKELFTVLGGVIAGVVVSVKAYQAAMVLITAAQIAWNAAVVIGNGLMTAATAIYNTARVAILLMSTGFTAAGVQATLLATAIWGQITAMTAAIAGWVRTGAAAVASGAQQAAALAVAAAGWVRLAVQQALATARAIAYTVAINAVRVATIAWTAVQWLLNAAMTANPIGIVIAVIVALVAAIVIAYQKSETFRAIVQATFSGIAAAAIWLWENALKPLWDGIVAGFEFVKAAAALWWTAVQAYFNLLAAAATTLWNWIKAAWNGIVAAFNFVVAGAASFVNSIIGFFGNLVSAVAGKVSSMISFVTSIPGRILSAVGNLGGLLYNAGANIIQGLINGISSMIGRLTGAVSGAVQKIRDYLPFSPAKVGPLSGSGAPEASGRKIAVGVADGIKAEQGAITSAMSAMASNLEMSTPAFAAMGAGTSTDQADGIRVWPGQGSAGDLGTLRVESGGTKMDDLLVEVLSKAVRVRGGNVQRVLGKNLAGVS